jgi:hypothetical protein
LFRAQEDVLGFKVVDGGHAFFAVTTFETEKQQQMQEMYRVVGPPGQSAGRVSGDNSILVMKRCSVTGLTHGINIKDCCR